MEKEYPASTSSVTPCRSHVDEHLEIKSKLITLVEDNAAGYYCELGEEMD